MYFVCHNAYSDFSVFFFNQKTAYEVRISDWSSDVCSSDLHVPVIRESIFSVNSMSKAFTGIAVMQLVEDGKLDLAAPISHYLDGQIGRASCRERVCQYV